MKRLLLLTILTIFCAGLSAREDRVSVKTSIDKSAAKIGERVNLSVAIEHPEGVSFSIPAGMEEFGDWNVTASGRKKPKNAKHTDFFLEMAAFSTGTMIVPSLEINYTAPDASTGSFKTFESSVTIQSVLAIYGDKGGLFDIHPPLSLPMPPWVILLIILAMIAAATAYYYFFVIKKKQALAGAPVIILEPADVVALRELAKLRESKLAEDGRIKEFYIILTDIMREYFVRVYGIEARDRTTSEIFFDLRVLEKNKILLSDIKNLLDDADLVKFAKFRPDALSALEDIAKSEKIITAKKIAEESSRNQAGGADAPFTKQNSGVLP